MSNQLVDMARQLLEIERDLPYRFNYKDGTRPHIDNFDCHMFEQSWGSTALGFGGVGGQSITSAITYVFVPKIEGQRCHVYFDGRYAYSADYTQALIDDMNKQRMASVSGSAKYSAEKEKDKM